jgi:hypothetical protein
MGCSASKKKKDMIPFLELGTDSQMKGLRMTTAKWVLKIACEGEEPITVATTGSRRNFIDMVTSLLVP